MDAGALQERCTATPLVRFTVTVVSGTSNHLFTGGDAASELNPPRFSRLLTNIQFQRQGIEGDRSECKVEGEGLQAQRSIVRNTQVDLGDTRHLRRRSARIVEES